MKVRFHFYDYIFSHFHEEYNSCLKKKHNDEFKQYVCYLMVEARTVSP